jgi:hypothetical protein
LRGGTVVYPEEELDPFIMGNDDGDRNGGGVPYDEEGSNLPDRLSDTDDNPPPPPTPLSRPGGRKDD